MTTKTIAQNVAPMTTRGPRAPTTKGLQKVMDKALKVAVVNAATTAAATKPKKTAAAKPAKTAKKTVAKKTVAAKKPAKVEGAKYANIKAGTKAERLLDMVTAKEGATKTAMLKMLGGWKGCGNYLAIACKKAGLTIERRKVDGETRWFAK